MTAWTEYPLTYWDFETSGLDDDSFIVTACIGDLGADPTEDAVPLQFLLAPPDGREIPDEATYGKRGTAFTGHGISTEHARAEGVPRETCRAGHALDEANTYLKPAGGRECRACRSNRDAARRRRHDAVA